MEDQAVVDDIIQTMIGTLSLFNFNLLILS